MDRERLDEHGFVIAGLHQRCLARIPITLQTDKEGSYLVFPSNIIEFYGMNSGHIDQLIHYMPYPFSSGVRVDSVE